MRLRLTGASKTIIPTEEPATSAPEQRELMAEASTTPATRRHENNVPNGLLSRKRNQ